MEMVGLTTITMENSSVQVQEQTKFTHNIFTIHPNIAHVFILKCTRYVNIDSIWAADTQHRTALHTIEHSICWLHVEMAEESKEKWKKIVDWM